ncbi:MAG: sulfatase-like hydrolase/transferase [Fimbriimonadaceae bacterium]|nr:sulfatase-like hydrolase/transferase [Fimbriimonadaceae bacterium]
MSNRRAFLRGATALAGAAALSLPRSAARAAGRPNILLFLVDDMGWRDCGAYGSTYYRTPAMDRLATQAMRFTDAYACPLCSPTRASILSGQYSARHGVTSASGHQPPQPPEQPLLAATAPANRPLILPESRNYLEPRQLTLAETLRDAGYRTAHLGKWHLGLTRPYWPEQQGFETAFHCHPDPGPPGSYFSPYGVVPDGEPTGQRRVGSITDGPAGEYITDRLTDEALRFLSRRDDRPFFLNLWHYGVHGPWGHKPAYTAGFAQLKDPTGRQGNPIMAAMLRSVDESLGRILGKLDELGLSDNTIVVFYGDNGGNTHSNTLEDVGEGTPKAATPQMQDWRKWAGNQPPTNNAPLRDGKGRLYEGGIRVPLMVRWPAQIAAGSQSAAVVGPIDLYPTLLDLCGVARPADQVIDGVSLTPVLRGSGPLAREAYFTWFPHLVPGVAVRQGDWKLIRRFEPRPEYEGLHELFNLRDDLGETTNLAAREPARVAALNALIDQFVKDTGALYPRPNPAYQAATTAPAAADPLTGLVARGCTFALAAGALQVTPTAATPFIGVGNVKLSGRLTLTIRLRGPAGDGQVQWKTAAQATFPAEGQVVTFRTTGGQAWQDLSLELPVEGPTGTIRIYLPGAGPTAIASLRFTAANGRKSWDFTTPVTR